MIISVVNIKGGVGKTTTAIALASAAARAGHEVRVLDSDPQGSSSEWALTAADEGEPLPFDVRSANIAFIRRLDGGDADAWTIIDCPPSGSVTDEAVAKSDFVVVPTSPATVDLTKTWETVDALESQGVAYGVLLTKVDTRTISYRSATAEIAEAGASAFDTSIPKREAIVVAFGHAFGDDDDLFGYDKVLAEIEEVTNGAV